MGIILFLEDLFNCARGWDLMYVSSDMFLCVIADLLDWILFLFYIFLWYTRYD